MQAARRAGCTLWQWYSCRWGVGRGDGGVSVSVVTGSLCVSLGAERCVVLVPLDIYISPLISTPSPLWLWYHWISIFPLLFPHHLPCGSGTVGYLYFPCYFHTISPVVLVPLDIYISPLISTLSPLWFWRWIPIFPLLFPHHLPCGSGTIGYLYFHSCYHCPL